MIVHQQQMQRFFDSWSAALLAPVSMRRIMIDCGAAARYLQMGACTGRGVDDAMAAQQAWRARGCPPAPSPHRLVLQPAEQPAGQTPARCQRHPTATCSQRVDLQKTRPVWLGRVWRCWSAPPGQCGRARCDIRPAGGCRRPPRKARRCAAAAHTLGCTYQRSAAASPSSSSCGGRKSLMMLRSSPSAFWAKVRSSFTWWISGAGSSDRLHLHQVAFDPAQTQADGCQRLAGGVVQLAGNAPAFGFLRPHHLVQQLAQHLLALLRLCLQQGVGHRQPQLLGDACHQRRLGRVEMVADRRQTHQHQAADQA